MKQGPLCPYRKCVVKGKRVALVRLRCMEKSPENQRISTQKGETTSHGRAPSPPIWVSGDGDRLQPTPTSADLAYRIAVAPSWGRGPTTGSLTARFDATHRRFDMFGGSNDLGIL